METELIEQFAAQLPSLLTDAGTSPRSFFATVFHDDLFVDAEASAADLHRFGSHARSTERIGSVRHVDEAIASRREGLRGALSSWRRY